MMKPYLETHNFSQIVYVYLNFKLKSSITLTESDSKFNKQTFKTKTEKMRLKKR